MNFMSGRIAQDDGVRFIADNGVFRIALPASWAESLADRADRGVILGFRPESLFGPGQRPADESITVADFIVDVVEPLGHEIFIHAHAGQDRVTARVPPQSVPRSGASIRLGIDLTRLHFFDPGTGQAIVAASRRAA
jgi:multiple sugar transport system ATP-binding protein